MNSAEASNPFFYLYDTLHSKLGIKLPFTHFERSVLRALNVAPTQLHPNSWAFVRAFELLCEDLGKAPTLGVFFWFFTPRKTDRVGWTSLSNRPKRTLLRPFLESYKAFKNRFFRVAPSDPTSRLLIDRDRRQYFPLQWTRQPAVSITVDVENLERWERAFIAELKELPIIDLDDDDDDGCTSQGLHRKKVISEIIAENEHASADTFKRRKCVSGIEIFTSTSPSSADTFKR
ncbi:hypothetical protein CR513_27456, partial [Mucuna pruriens]